MPGIPEKEVEKKRGEWKQKFLKERGQDGLRGGYLKKRGMEPPSEP